MFILHPSSRCDVCLDAFTGDTDMAPHAIPCGHVFCKTCLASVMPPKCPLCRKVYDPQRLKKLHVDRPEGLQDPKEAELLQRLALSFDASEEPLRELLEEVEDWLSEQLEDAFLPIRKARQALAKYQELRHMGIESKREITLLHQEIEYKKNEIEHEKGQARDIENALLKKKEQLESQLASHKTEIEQLRAELHRRTGKNPLPLPPQPISLDRYPGFAQATAAGTDAWYNDNGRSLLPPSKIPANGLSYVHPRNLWPDDDRENRNEVLSDSNGVKRDRKGKTRDNNVDPTSEVYRAMYGPAPRPVTTTGYPVVQLEAPKPKAGIIPGATPNSKFMPPDPDVEKERGWNAFKPPDLVPPVIEPEDKITRRHSFDPARDSVDPWSLTAALLPEYVTGYAEGYASAHQTGQNAIASGSRTQSGDLEPSFPVPMERTSSQERRERRERHRERRREREKEGRQREGGRDREGPSSSSHRRVTEPEGIAPLSSSAPRPAPTTDDEVVASRRPHARRHVTMDMDGAQRVQAHGQANLSSVLSDNPPRSRRHSQSRPSTTAPVPQPQPVIPILPQPVMPQVPQPQIHSTSGLVQPSARMPAAQQPSMMSDGSAELRSPASRRSIQSEASNASSWGTLSSGNPDDVTPNSFVSLNLRSFTRYPVIPSNSQSYRSPTRAFPQVESSDEETETERVVHGRTPHNPAELNPMVHPQRDDQPQAPPQSRDRRAVYPSLSASAAAPAGSRHTTITITDHYQNPALAYQRPPSAIQSAGVITENHTSSQAARSRARGERENRQHNHSSSQGDITTMTAALNNNNHASRTRRLSSAAASSSSSSLPPFSSNNVNGPPPHSAPAMEYVWVARDNNDVGYHTDAPHTGNALGLAISLEARDGPASITAPAPLVPSRSFLQSFSGYSYAQ